MFDIIFVLNLLLTIPLQLNYPQSVDKMWTITNILYMNLYTRLWKT